MHPLKLVSLISLCGLVLTQAGLIGWLHDDNRFLLAGLLSIPLLLPIAGLLKDRLYTFKWVGFLCLAYFMIGVSESFSNPDLRVYSILNILLSLGLFFSSIYYSRFLRSHQG